METNFLKRACDFLEKESKDKGIYYTPKCIVTKIQAEVIIENPPYNGTIFRANSQNKESN
jgi:hypothetical protein